MCCRKPQHSAKVIARAHHAYPGYSPPWPRHDKAEQDSGSVLHNGEGGARVRQVCLRQLPV